MILSCSCGRSSLRSSFCLIRSKHQILIYICVSQIHVASLGTLCHDRKNKIVYPICLSVISEGSWEWACILSLSFDAVLWEFLSDKKNGEMMLYLKFPTVHKNLQICVWLTFLYLAIERGLYFVLALNPIFIQICIVWLGCCFASVLPLVLPHNWFLFRVSQLITACIICGKLVHSLQ